MGRGWVDSIPKCGISLLTKSTSKPSPLIYPATMANVSCSFSGNRIEDSAKQLVRQTFAGAKAVHGREWSSGFEMPSVADKAFKLLEGNRKGFELRAVVIHYLSISPARCR